MRSIVAASRQIEREQQRGIANSLSAKHQLDKLAAAERAALESTPMKMTSIS